MSDPPELEPHAAAGDAEAQFARAAKLLSHPNSPGAFVEGSMLVERAAAGGHATLFKGGDRGGEEDHRLRASEIYASLLQQTPSDPDVLKPYFSNAAALVSLLPPGQRGAFCRQALENHADRAASALADPEVGAAFERLRETCRR